MTKKYKALGEKFDKLEGYPRTCPKPFVYSMREVRYLGVSIGASCYQMRKGNPGMALPTMGAVSETPL